MTKISKSVRLTSSEERNEDIWAVLQEANVTVNSDCYHIESLNGGTNSMFSVQIGEEKRGGFFATLIPPPPFGEFHIGRT